jgi:hypothetical protein
MLRCCVSESDKLSDTTVKSLKGRRAVKQKYKLNIYFETDLARRTRLALFFRDVTF